MVTEGGRAFTVGCKNVKEDKGDKGEKNYLIWLVLNKIGPIISIMRWESRYSRMILKKDKHPIEKLRIAFENPPNSKHGTAIVTLHCLATTSVVAPASLPIPA
jgi:hypothetical protein